MACVNLFAGMSKMKSRAYFGLPPRLPCSTLILVRITAVIAPLAGLVHVMQHRDQSAAAACRYVPVLEPVSGFREQGLVATSQSVAWPVAGRDRSSDMEGE